MDSVPTILHDTIRDLHRIGKASHEHGISVLPSILRGIVGNLYVLLGIGEKHKHEVTVTCNTLPALRIVFHTSPRTLSETSDFTYDNICRFLNERLSSLTPDNIYLQLLTLLTECYKTERGPAHVKQSYAPIISHFSQLVLRFVELHNSAEHALLQYLLQCYIMEHAHNSALDNQLLIPNSDTEKIMGALDGFFKKPDPDVDDSSELLDSMFSYDDASPKSDINPVGFESSDDYFHKLYSNFLQVALRKPQESFKESSYSYLKVMLGIFKKTINADFLEIGSYESSEEKIALIVDFLCDCNDGSIESESFRKQVESVISKFLSEDVVVSHLSLEVVDSWQSSMSQINVSSSPQAFLTEDILNLISEVSAVFDSVRESLVEFDLYFPHVFHYYLVLVYEELAEEATEQDFNYIQIIGNTIHSIITYDRLKDESDDALLTILQDLHREQSMLITGLAQQSLLMRAAVTHYIRTTTMLTRFVRRWNMRLLAVNHLDVVFEKNIARFTTLRRLKKSFSRWYVRTFKNKDLYEHAAKYSDKRLLTQYFNSYLIQPYLLISANEARADTYKLARFFLKWKVKLGNLDERRDQLRGIVALKQCQVHFKKWRLAHRQLMLKESLALQYRLQTVVMEQKMVLKYILENWQDKLLAKILPGLTQIQISQLFTELDSKAKVFLFRKHFLLWLKKYNLNLSVCAFDESKRLLTLKTFSTKWMAVHNLLKHEEEYIQFRYLLLKREFFLNWKCISKNRIQADAFHRQKVLSAYFKHMRQVRAVNAHQLLLDAIAIRTVWTKWKLQLYANENQVTSLARTFGLWHGKCKAFNLALTNAETQYDLKVMKHTLLSWDRLLHLLEYLTNVADLNFQRNILNRISRKVHQHRVQFQLADAHYLNNMATKNRNTLRLHFNDWRVKFHELFENKSEALIVRFKEEVSERRIKKLLFRLWSKKMTTVQEKATRLEYALLQFQHTSAVVRVTFNQWIDSTNNSYDRMEQAEDFYVTNLSEKAWRIWIQKYIRVANYLNIQADNITDRKDFDSAVAILRKWYYKYATVVSATENICNKFLEKKKRLNLKIMFELWVHKHHSKQATYLSDMYHEANSSFGSNSSPLARKNNNSRANDLILGNESYFYTPLEASSPFTPVKNKTSPNRLHETNQRLKLNRMDALTRRFRRANINEDIPRSALKGGSFPKLSPPKRALKASSITEPPPSLSFENFKLQTPIDSHLFVSRTLVSAVDDDDQSLIETAKSLQRIKPIVIPYEESPTQLRYSTLHTLKDRLQSAQSSPLRPQ